MLSKLVLTEASLVETQQFFLYVAVTDNKTCKHCNRYHMSYMTRREIYSRFKSLVKVNDEFWLPRVHMDLWNRDNCRCGLLLAESTPESILQKLLNTSLEGYTPYQRHIHALALSSICAIRVILIKESAKRKIKNARV